MDIGLYTVKNDLVLKPLCPDRLLGLLSVFSVADQVQPTIGMFFVNFLSESKENETKERRTEVEGFNLQMFSTFTN